MEEKLKAYRALRRRKELETISETIESEKQSSANSLAGRMDNKEGENLIDTGDRHPVLDLQEKPTLQLESDSDIDIVSEKEHDFTQESWKYFVVKWTLYATIWISLYIFFLKIQFGAVFFVVSVLIGIFLNTRTRPKKLGEVSAYSVFNENCVSIDGTLTAEQFEKEIRYGPGSV